LPFIVILFGKLSPPLQLIAFIICQVFRKYAMDAMDGRGWEKIDNGLFWAVMTDQVMIWT